jgi:phenol/toluene 2-monooxygenase (NADH) P0/A0
MGRALSRWPLQITAPPLKPPMTHQSRTNQLAPAADSPLAVDTSRRFVRVTERRADGLVAFEFAIGWPELSVDLLLPSAAFAEFCQRNQVQRLDS